MLTGISISNFGKYDVSKLFDEITFLGNIKVNYIH